MSSEDSKTTITFSFDELILLKEIMLDSQGMSDYRFLIEDLLFNYGKKSSIYTLSKKIFETKEPWNENQLEAYSGTCENCGMMFFQCTYEFCPGCNARIIPDQEEIE